MIDHRHNFNRYRWQRNTIYFTNCHKIIRNSWAMPTIRTMNSKPHVSHTKIRRVQFIYGHSDQQYWCRVHRGHPTKIFQFYSRHSIVSRLHNGISDNLAMERMRMSENRFVCLVQKVTKKQFARIRRIIRIYFALSRVKDRRSQPIWDKLPIVIGSMWRLWHRGWPPKTIHFVWQRPIWAFAYITAPVA